MIDLTHLEQYRENNRIEAKKALGGLPHSIWETYSAFANTLGGIILLGVEEYKDKSLHTVDLPDPEALVGEFWALVNDPKKASVNILSSRDVNIETVNGDHIVVIEVPRAQRYHKPVYVDGDPVSGTYRRSGEGDYRCTDEELRAMQRDAGAKTQDMLLLENLDSSVFCAESVLAYRQRMRLSHPEHAWEKLDGEEFLMKLGAVGIGRDGKRHPTAAGLLMFGYERDIVREYPRYLLDYREEGGDALLWTDRIISSSGDWSGNVFDFYFRVYNRLQWDITAPPETEDGVSADDMPVRKAVREALTNCVVNADYYGRQGLVIIKKRGMITMSNPGGFRIAVDDARAGGLSDPRNGVMMKMLSLIDVSQCSGSGLPGIYYIWKQQGWDRPIITQAFDPDRVTLSLTFGKTSEKSSAEAGADARTAERQKDMIIEYLTDHASAKASELAELLGVTLSRAETLLEKLIAEDIVAAERGTRKRSYRLKA